MMMKLNMLFRTCVYALVCAGLMGVGACSKKGAEPKPPVETEKPDEQQDNEDDRDPPSNGQTIPLADPFILLHEGTYYAYGTGGYLGFEVATSKTLKVWNRRQGKRTNGMALHKDDVWGDEGFWAPEVYYIDGTFYMYYTAEEHLCVATSDSPLGPFTQQVQAPMLDERAIDNTLFRDADGKYYMYFDSFRKGMSIWRAELEPNLLELKENTMEEVLVRTQPWESVSQAKVIEGSFVIKRGETYYMIYSANNFIHQSYGIGCATATSPLGPWTKYSFNPLLQKPGNLVGTGHGALFEDKNGQMKLVFHAHKSQTEVHPRQMYITDVFFAADGRMSISSDFIVPTAAK